MYLPFLNTVESLNLFGHISWNNRIFQGFDWKRLFQRFAQDVKRNP